MKTVGDRLNTIEKQLNKKQETCVKNCLRVKWKWNGYNKTKCQGRQIQGGIIQT